MKEENVQKKPTRLSLTFGWWFVQVIGWGLIIPMFHIENPFPLWVVFVVVLLIQGIIHWKLLMKHYPEKRTNNILLVISMPILIFFGLWVTLLFESAMVGFAGG